MINAVSNVRYYKYVGPTTRTRGEYGEVITGGRSYAETGHQEIVAFDAAFGDTKVGTPRDSDWVEVTEEEYNSL